MSTNTHTPDSTNTDAIALPGNTPDTLHITLAEHEIPYTPNETFELTITPNGVEKTTTPMTDPADDVIGAYELYQTDDGEYRVTLDSNYEHKDVIKNLPYSCDAQWNPDKNAWTIRFMNPDTTGMSGLRLAANQLHKNGLTLHITPTLVTTLINTQHLA